MAATVHSMNHLSSYCNLLFLSFGSLECYMHSRDLSGWPFLWSVWFYPIEPTEEALCLPVNSRNVTRCFSVAETRKLHELQGTSRNRQSCGIHSVDTRIYLNIRVVISRWPDNRRHLLIVAHIGRRNDKFYDCIARKRIREIFKFPALKLLNYVDQVLMSAQSANYCCGQFRAINSSLVRLLPLSGPLALLAVLVFRVHSAAISRSQILSASCLDAMIKS